MSSKKLLHSPLRYPGGKSRATQRIANQLPEHFSEYREPFVGGGSVFVYVRQKYPQVRMWMNDLNFDLFCFWKQAQRDAEGLAASIHQVKDATRDGKRLFETLRAQAEMPLSDFERAVRYFVLNRISFSGTVDSGGYSEGAFRERFTDSSIARLVRLATLLQDVKITNEDYKQVIRADGEDVLVFLDPPYLTATKSRLYGMNGALHTSFNHDEFAREMYECPHMWLITYDDSPAIRENFSFAFKDEWQLQYGMNNYKKDSAAKGQELFITNYVPPRAATQRTLFEIRQAYRSGIRKNP